MQHSQSVHWKKDYLLVSTVGPKGTCFHATSVSASGSGARRQSILFGASASCTKQICTCWRCDRKRAAISSSAACRKRSCGRRQSILLGASASCGKNKEYLIAPDCVCEKEPADVVSVKKVQEESTGAEHQESLSGCSDHALQQQSGSTAGLLCALPITRRIHTARSESTMPRTHLEAGHLAIRLQLQRTPREQRVVKGADCPKQPVRQTCQHEHQSKDQECALPAAMRAPTAARSKRR